MNQPNRSSAEPIELQRFRATVINVADAVTVELSGEIDLATVSEIRESLDFAVDASGGDVIVDLTAVTFLDSTMLRELILAHQRLDRDQRRLMVRNPSKFVHRVFELSDLLGLLEANSAELTAD